MAVGIRNATVMSGNNLTIPGGTADGDSLLMVAMLTNNTSSVTDPALVNTPSGWTLSYTGLLVNAKNYGGQRVYVWTRLGFANLAGTAVTLTTQTGTNNFYRGGIISITGAFWVPRTVTANGGSAGSGVLYINNNANAAATDTVFNWLFFAQSTTSGTSVPTVSKPGAVTQVIGLNYGGNFYQSEFAGYAPQGEQQFVITPANQFFTGLQIPYYAGSNPVYAHPGKTITAYAKMAGRGFRNKAMLKSSQVQAGSLSFTYPSAQTVDNDVLLMVVQAYSTAATLTAPTLTPPAGWTTLIDTLNGAQVTQRLAVYARTTATALTGTFTVTASTSTGMDFVTQLLLVRGISPTPRVLGVNLGGSTTYNAANPVAIPAVTGTLPGDTVLSLISAMTTASGAGTRTWSTTPPPTGGVVWGVIDSSKTAFNELGQTTMWWPGAQSFTPSADVRAITAQLALQPAIIKAHTGGRITGYSKIITTSTGRKKVAAGRGGRITGYARIAAQRGVFVPKPNDHRGVPLIGYAKITDRRGIYKRVRPHIRTTVSATTNATQLSFLIPAATQPSDMLFLEVGYAGSGAIVAPDGWQVIEDNTVADTTSGAVRSTFYKSAGWTDAGTTVLVNTTSAAQAAGVLGVYTPGVIDAQSTTTTSPGSLRVLFGPGTADPGTTRIALGTLRATGAGDQIAVTQPLTVLDGATAAVPRGTAENPAGLSLASFIADYTGNTALAGQVTSQVPVRGRTQVFDVEGVEFHRGTITQKGHLGGGQGIKHATDGTNQLARIVGYFGRTTANEHHGAHSDINAAGDPGQIVAEAKIILHQGVVYDSYHGGRIDAYDASTGSGNGFHDTGYTGQLHGFGHINVRRGSQQARHPGTPITGYAALHGEGRRTRRHPGKPIIGYAVLHGISGSTRVNVIKGYLSLSAPEHHGQHSDVGAAGGPGRITGEIKLSGSGSGQSTVDERYTQIRGYARLHGEGLAAGPRTVFAGQGSIVGYAMLAGSDLMPHTPEEINVEVALGPVRLVVAVISDVEDFEMSVTQGNPTVNRLVPGQMFTSTVRYSQRPEPSQPRVSANQVRVTRSEPGYPYTTGGPRL